MHKFAVLATLALLGSAAAHAQKPADTSMYPAATAQNTRHIFHLPAQKNEAHYKVEIVAGKTMGVDCNRVMIKADLSSEDVKGWGYTYYTIDDIGAPATTMMACPNTPKTNKFVAMNLGDDGLVRYNSKLPLVVYAPKDVQVGYRIWATTSTTVGITGK